MSNNINSNSSTEEIISKRKEIIQKIKLILIDRLNLDYKPEDIPDDAILFGEGIGLDSIDALQLIVGVESEFNITFPQEQSAILRSVNTIADFVLTSKKLENCEIKTEDNPEDHLNYTNLDQESAYYAVRNDMAIISHENLAVIKVNLTQTNLENLDKLLSAKIKQVNENIILPSLILNDSLDCALAYIELYNCGDHFLILINKDKKILIENAIQDFVDVTDSFKLFSLEGPNSAKYLEQLIGAEVIGLRPNNHTLVHSELFSMRIANSSHTGEFGYLFFCPNESNQSLLKKIEQNLNKPLKYVEHNTHRILQLESCLSKFNLDLLTPNQENPFSAGLSWMIDLQKYPHLDNLQSNKLVLIRGKKGEHTIKINEKLIVNNREIGYVSACEFSPLLEKIIGFAYVETDYAWPGVTTDSGIQLVSAPFILTKSHSQKEG